jgi:hypothetical protein
MKIGLFSKSQLKSREKDNIAVSMPTPRASKKGQAICSSIGRILKVTKSLRLLKSNDLIASINSSYIPRIKAMVPPETPGTTSEAPIQKPFALRMIY